MKGVLLRAAIAADRAFLYHLHRAALKDCITAVWGWDEEWQRNHFDQHFDPQRRQIISLNGERIGALGVAEREDDIFIDYIALHPHYQRRGIGSALIKTILKQGASSGKPVRLRVLRTNPAAALYRRLSFLVEEASDTHTQMRYSEGGCQ